MRRSRGGDEPNEVVRAVLTVQEAIAALPGRDISVVLHALALQAQSLTRARYVAVGFGTNPGKPFDPWIQLGVGHAVARALGRPPRPVGILGRVACDGEVVRTRDLTRHPSFRGLPSGHPPMSSFLGVPIRYQGRAVGNLYLADKVGAPEFSEDDERVMVTLAARTGVAIEMARLYAEEAQRHSWLRTIIDQMPEGVLFLDRDGQTIAMNRALHSFLGSNAPHLLPLGESKALDVRLPDGTAVPQDALPSARALRDGEVTTARELVVCLGDGRLVPILANAAPVRDDQGQISGATLIIQDITPLKEIERLREEWTSVVAHDLRQPVSVIALSAESIGRLDRGGLPASERRAIDRIGSAARRLNRMIDDLLDASLLESKRLTVDRHALDLVALLQIVKEENEGLAADHEVRIVAPPGPLLCWVDPDRIRQVLQNLISNAVKYGRPGGEIRVAAIEHEAAIEVAVTNDGPGIPAEAIPTLFDRFVRTRAARAGRAPGLGLGLYITKGVIEAHGGRVWVESTLGRSTTFHFTVAKAPPVALMPAAESHADP
jgi:PAS domain S-box-containing protein